MTGSPILCDFCTATIRPEDFERGKAVILLKKRYCSECMAAEVARSKRKHAPPAPAFVTPPQRPPRPPESRRRHERKECSIPVELSIYLSDGRLFDQGEAVLWNISLSGALLRALVLPEKSLPVEPHTIGIRVLDGVLKNLQILGRTVRFVHSEEGLHLAIEFVRTEEAQLTQLRKFI